MTRKFYITTPIYYVNARPHIGHAYTTIACDTIARRQRMLGADTFFLTGTDEHGQKIERAAEAAGKSPQQYADEISGEFRALWKRMGISNDDFIRTTEERHKKRLQELFRRIRDNGYIYKGTYTGQYCVSDELYVDGAQPGDPCPICGRITETVQEENYFFKLSAFQDKLLELYANPDFIRPETRRNEVISFVRSGLRDQSISRSTFSWGVPVPDDPKHVIYVWFDALANYITAIGYGSSHAGAQEAFKKVLARRCAHDRARKLSAFIACTGRHFLLAAGLPLPKAIVAHGWLLFEESKMSKSRGNIVRTETILDVLGADALRYFLLREVVFGQDGSFSFDALVQRYNSDLANGIGNLASRTLTMINRYFKGEVPYPSHAAAKHGGDDVVAETARKTIREFSTLFDQFQFSRALETAWGLVATVDKYIVENEPWSLGEKQDDESRARLATVLYTSAEALRDCDGAGASGNSRCDREDLAADGTGRHQETRLEPARLGVNCHLAPSLAMSARCFPAPIRARSKGCRRWKISNEGRPPRKRRLQPQRRRPLPALAAASPGRRWQDHDRRLRQSRSAGGTGEGRRARSEVRQAARGSKSILGQKCGRCSRESPRLMRPRRWWGARS